MSDADTESDEQAEKGLTTRTGLVWEWLPTFVAIVYLGTFAFLVTATTLPIPIDVSVVPAEWFVPYLLIVGGSAVTTIGADAIASWKDLQG